MNPQPTDRPALGYGVGAYLLWGFLPLYWVLVDAAGALELLAHRIVWSLVFAVIMLVVLRRSWSWLPTVFTRERLPRLLAAAALIAVNWLTYIFSVNNGFVVEAALGYFINPLVNVALGALIFAERVPRLAKIGVALAFVGVGVIAWESWRTLWISLLLAGSFGMYGVVKKGAHVPALQGVAIESALLTPLALGYLVWLQVIGRGTFGTDPTFNAVIVLAGPVTALPLWLFAIAAPRLPFGVVGVLQYLAPTIQFILGITLFGQHVVPSYWAGLVLVWAGSLLFLNAVLGRPRAST